MTYNAIVESKDHRGYRATVLGWPNCSANGATKEEALERLREVIRTRVSEGEIVRIDVDLPGSHPWMKFAGMFEDDPMFDQLVEEIEAYRRELDADDRVV